MNRKLVWFLTVALLAAAMIFAGPSQAADKDAEAKLVTIETPYYTLYTDLDIDRVREAYARLTAMAEEYHERTKGFARPIKSRLPVYMFSTNEGYAKAGGMAGSAGVFMGDKLMVKATPQLGEQVWNIMQHEGFHQFAHSVISRNLPTWLNEGLAEYFGHGIWTGDNMVTGMVSPGWLKQIKSLIEQDKMLPFLEMLMMSHEEWNRQLDRRNYDQAWSMVHFLVHADNGKYCNAFSDFINDLSKGQHGDKAFQARFGNDVKAFQQRYNEWWKAMDEKGTQDVLRRARMHTLTSYLARATFLKLKFDKPEGFLAACKEDKIKIDGAKIPQLWLPPSLLAAALADAPKMGAFTLDTTRATPRLILTQADGAILTGEFKLKGADSPEVKVTLIAPKTATSKPAK